MNETKFKEGDKLLTIYGGPILVVTFYDKHTKQYRCNHWTLKNELKQNSFYEYELVPYSNIERNEPVPSPPPPPPKKKVKEDITFFPKYIWKEINKLRKNMIEKIQSGSMKAFVGVMNVLSSPIDYFLEKQIQNEKKGITIPMNPTEQKVYLGVFCFLMPLALIVILL